MAWAIERSRPLHHPLGVALAATAIGTGAALWPQTTLLAAAVSGGLFLVWLHPSATLIALGLATGLNVDVLQAPVHVSLPQVIALAMICGVALRPVQRLAVQGPPSSPPRRGLWCWGGLLFVAATLPSMPTALNTTSAIAGLIQLTAAGLILFAASDWLRTRPGMADDVAGAIVVGACLSVLAGVLQWASGGGLATNGGEGPVRVYATYGQPNSWGAYLVGAAPLAAALSKRHWAYGAAVLPLCFGVFMSGSRGGWIALLVGFAALYLLSTRLRPSTFAVGALGCIALVTIPFWLPAEYLARFSFQDWSTQQRLLLILMTWNGILARPLVGYGSGSFQDMVPDVLLAGYTDDVEHPHNLILHLWVELGLLAVIVAAALVTVFLVVTARAYRRTRDPVLAGAAAGAVGMLAAAMFGTLIERGRLETFMLLVAIAGAGVLRHQLTTPRPAAPLKFFSTPAENQRPTRGNPPLESRPPHHPGELDG